MCVLFLLFVCVCALLSSFCSIFLLLLLQAQEQKREQERRRAAGNSVSGNTAGAKGESKSARPGLQLGNKSEGGSAGGAGGAGAAGGAAAGKKTGADGEEVDGNHMIGAYSPRSRRRRIERFLEKRQQRVWTKKTQYNVRCATAPRVGIPVLVSLGLFTSFHRCINPLTL